MLSSPRPLTACRTTRPTFWLLPATCSAPGPVSAHWPNRSLIPHQTSPRSSSPSFLALRRSLERRRILERTARGRADVKEKGVKFGRMPILTPHQQKGGPGRRIMPPGRRSAASPVATTSVRVRFTNHSLIIVHVCKSAIYPRIFTLALVLIPTNSPNHGIFPLTLPPLFHDLADVATIGSFLLTIALVFLAARPPSTARISNNGITQVPRRQSSRRLRRPVVIALAFVFGLLTIALFLYAGETARPDVHLATAYWYSNDLDNLNNLVAKWDNITDQTLHNYLENRGALPYSPDNDLDTIDANIEVSCVMTSLSN